MCFQAKAGHKGVWGADPPRAGAVQQHTVMGISYHQGGSSRRAKGAQPFAIIELEVSVFFFLGGEGLGAPIPPVLLVIEDACARAGRIMRELWGFHDSL